VQNIITMEVLIAVSENGFSLDELVFRTKELFEREGLSGFVSLILQLADDRLRIQDNVMLVLMNIRPRNPQPPGR
jgi:hypothetical protein